MGGREQMDFLVGLEVSQNLVEEMNVPRNYRNLLPLYGHIGLEAAAFFLSFFLFF